MRSKVKVFSSRTSSRQPRRKQPALLTRDALRALKVTLDVMQTGPAIRTYNVMIGERRRVAAALIAVP